jgi:hypothetical protein
VACRWRPTRHESLRQAEAALGGKASSENRMDNLISFPECQSASDWALAHFRCRFPRRHVAQRRARSRSRFARPYICRLIILSLVMWPSVCPLDQGLQRDNLDENIVNQDENPGRGRRRA